MPMSVTKRSASGMRLGSTSLGSMARSWTAKPHRVGQRAKSERIRASTSASSLPRRLSNCWVVFMGSTVLACSKKANRGIPETTTDETLVQGPCEGAAAQPPPGLRLFLEQLTEGLGDVLVNLAVLLGGEPWRNADIAHVE